MEIHCSRRRLSKIKENRGLRAIQPKSFKPRTTESRHRLGYSPNLLPELPEPDAFGQLWVGNITYIPVEGIGFGYLATLMDRYSRRIFGRDFRDDMTEQLAVTALRRSIRAVQPPPGLIHHTDRGGQYAGKRCRGILSRAAMRQSMSRAGDCYDNAFMESCFGRVKTEMSMTEHTRMAIARRELAEYIDGTFQSAERIACEYREKTISVMAFGFPITGFDRRHCLLSRVIAPSSPALLPPDRHKLHLPRSGGEGGRHPEWGWRRRQRMVPPADNGGPMR